MALARLGRQATVDRPSTTVAGEEPVVALVAHDTQAGGRAAHAFLAYQPVEAGEGETDQAAVALHAIPTQEGEVAARAQRARYLRGGRRHPRRKAVVIGRLPGKELPPAGFCRSPGRRRLLLTGAPGLGLVAAVAELAQAPVPAGKALLCWRQCVASRQLLVGEPVTLPRQLLTRPAGPRERR